MISSFSSSSSGGGNTAKHVAPDRRTQLLDVLSRAALTIGSSPVSLRQFAIRAGVSEPTLRHYFGDRQGVVIAILEHLAGHAEDWLARAAAPAGAVRDALAGYADLAVEGADTDMFVRAHSFALVESIHDAKVAETYRRVMIEPSITAIEARLAAAPDAPADETARREAAFAFYASILFGVLHQRLLRGADARPLDLPGFFARLAGTLAGGVREGS